jgi:PAS domain S-box-containing protein
MTITHPPAPAPPHPAQFYAFATGVTLFHQDADLRYTWIQNPIPGYDADFLLGKTDTEIPHLIDDPATLIAAKRQVVRTGQRATVEVPYTRGHTTSWHYVTLEPARDAHGHITGLYGASVDITEKKQAEVLLRKHAAIFENQSDAVIVADLHGVITDWNPAAERITGYARTEALGRPASFLLRPGEAETLPAAAIGTALAKGTWRREIVFVRKDGSLGTCDAVLTPLLDAAGRPYAILGVYRDLSTSIAAADALHKLQVQFQAFMNNSPTPAWITDEHGTIVYTSDTYYRSFQTGGRIEGRRLHDYAPKPIADVWLENIRRVAETGETVANMEPAPRADGTVGRFLVYKFPLPRDDGRRLVGGVAVDITERLAAESALHESEQRFALVARTLNDGIWEWDPATRENWWSPRNFDLLGYAPGEVDATTDWFDAQLHPDDRPRVWAAAADHLAGKTDEYRCEFRVRHKDGGWRWFSTRGKAVRDAAGRGIRMIGAQADITDHKRAIIALAESREQLALAVNGAGLGTFYCEIPFNKILWNDTCKAHFWLPPDAEIDFDVFYACIHPDDREPTRRAIDRAMADHVLYNVEYRTVAPDGRQRWINAVGRFYYHPDGAPRRFDGITIDVTERKLAQDALRASEERYRFLADNIPQLAWTSDARGIPHSFNSRWYAYTGFSPAAPTDQAAVRDVVHPDDRPVALEQWAAALDTGEACTVEYRLRRHDGVYRWHLAQVAPMRDAAGRITHWFGTCTDIDDRKRAQAENARLLEEAQNANAAKDRFLAVLSHELRTPLTPVVMALAALDLDEALPRHLRRDVAMIRRNIDLETQLIDDLLDVTRIANGKLRLARQPVHAHALLDHVCSICGPEAQARGITVSCDFAAARDYLVGDPARLEQVFWNLLKNAIKFTPENGRIRLRTADAAGGQLLVEVEDSGVGIDPAVLPRIFNAFEQGEQTVTRTFGGLGLGLAISKAIIDLHHGTITARSPGKDAGSTFSILLPLAPAPASVPDAPAARPAAASPRGTLRILLVDDHADTLAVTRRLLTAFGHAVVTAASVAEATRAVQENAFDLLISDVGLPDGSGIDLITLLRRLYPVLPAIALSGFGMEADIRKCLDAGFNAHLTKPVSLDRLQETIAALTRHLA